MLYIGVDLGTSACKFLLVDENGKVKNTVTKEYPLFFPHPGWSEQDPAHWWNACLEGIPELLRGFDASQVAGIGAGGQMHGLVALDDQDQVLRPAILWNDGRTAAQVDYLNHTVGKDKLSRCTANIAFAGFTAPKLLWMQQQEPELFGRIAKIMLPKDYLVYRLTGVHATDLSDASGMLLLDVEHRCWSREMLDICGIAEKQMPRLFESWAPREPSLFPPSASASTPTMPSTPLPMRTAAGISWAVCCRRPPAINGGRMRSSAPPIIRERKPAFYPKSWAKITSIFCPTSWESAAPSTIPTPGEPSSA